MAELIRYLFLDAEADRECVLTMDGVLPKIKEQHGAVFNDTDAMYEVVRLDPQPYLREGDLIRRRACMGTPFRQPS